MENRAILMQIALDCSTLEWKIVILEGEGIDLIKKIGGKWLYLLFCNFFLEILMEKSRKSAKNREKL